MYDHNLLEPACSSIELLSTVQLCVRVVFANPIPGIQKFSFMMGSKYNEHGHF